MKVDTLPSTSVMDERQIAPVTPLVTQENVVTFP